MLENKDLDRLEQSIGKLTDTIFADIQRSIQAGGNSRDIIDTAVRTTVNRVTPESKMLLSSVYNMLSKKTLSGPLYQSPQNMAAFYERNILGDLTAGFSFDVPNHIDYEETRQLLNRWTASGAVVVAGGVISVTMKNVVPVAVAVLLAGIMLLLTKDRPVSGSREVNDLIAEYLGEVRQSLMCWIHEIEKYYDDEVCKLEKELS